VKSVRLWGGNDVTAGGVRESRSKNNPSGPRTGFFGRSSVAARRGSGEEAHDGFLGSSIYRRARYELNEKSKSLNDGGC